MMALYRVFAATALSVAKHELNPPNKKNVQAERHRCEQVKKTGCGASLTIFTNTQDGRTTIKVNNGLHNHQPPNRRRMQKLVRDMFRERIKAMQEAGASNYRAYNRTNADMRVQTGRSFEPHQVSGLLLRQQKRRRSDFLQERAKGAAALFEVDSGDDSTNEDHDNPRLGLRVDRLESLPVNPHNDKNKDRLVLQALIRLVQEKQALHPDLYVNVQHKDLAIVYYFQALRYQRLAGRLFGQIQAIDDKHFVTDKGYQLVVIAVVNNIGGVEPAAFALVPSSSCNWYTHVIRDCQLAFEVVEDIGRPWKRFLADQDSAISSACVGVDNEVKKMTCFRHWKENIHKKHGRDHAIYEPVFEGMGMLMRETKQWRYAGIEKKLQQLVEAVPDTSESLKTKLQTFFEEAKTRKLCDLDSFTNGWTSQSIAESAFAATSKLKLGPQQNVFEVVDSLFDYCESREARLKDTPVRSRNGVSVEMRKTSDLLTSHAYDDFSHELNEIREYECVVDEGSRFRVTRVGNTHSHHFHTVDYSDGSCSCNRGVWKGLPCRHVLRVRHQEQKGYVHDLSLFSERWHRSQPDVRFANDSPASASIFRRTQSAAAANPSSSSSTCTGLPAVVSQPKQLSPLFIGQHRHRGNIRPQCPAELSADCMQRFAGHIGRAGHDPVLLSQTADLLDGVESTAVSATQGARDRERALNLPTVGTRIGRRQETRFKSAAVEGRSNAVRKKKKGCCGHCGVAGHNRTKCPGLRVRFGPVEEGESEEEFRVGSDSDSEAGGGGSGSDGTAAAKRYRIEVVV
eukprot:GHVU01060191.1.p1 GENE.GHVU01060191.1~~GHVU01060191.1.p1  ORF type:complete len:795 (+),score=85.86 GHVU01060191.1:281-2665(+)